MAVSVSVRSGSCWDAAWLDSIVRGMSAASVRSKAKAVPFYSW